MRQETNVLELHSDEFEAAGWRHADWKDGAGSVLDGIDEQLKPFGLEVVVAEDTDDGYAWRIDRISDEWDADGDDE